MSGKLARGVVHGKTIELAEDLGLAEGLEVEIRVEVVSRRKPLPGPPPGWRPEGSPSAAGMLAGSWTEEDDRILDEIEQDRRHSSTREVPE